MLKFIHLLHHSLLQYHDVQSLKLSSESCWAHTYGPITSASLNDMQSQHKLQLQGYLHYQCSLFINLAQWPIYSSWHYMYRVMYKSIKKCGFTCTLPITSNLSLFKCTIWPQKRIGWSNWIQFSMLNVYLLHISMIVS